MNYLTGLAQLVFMLALGTWTYSVNPKGGWLGHVFFAFVYSYWITLWIFKAVPYVQKAIRALRLDFWR